jgi:hypothetical protein
VTIIRVLLPAFAALLAPAAAIAQEPDIVVRAESPRAEIERILDADNLDTGRLTPREVTEIMMGIARGRAPEDFWSAYQLHVRAWARLADAVDRVQPQTGAGSAFPEGRDELAAAAVAIETTFDEVERIALRYHARLPAPRVDTRTIA